MSSRAATISTETKQDLTWAKAVVGYRNAVLWPTRQLQRLIGCGCVAALGFILAPGPGRYSLLTLAALGLLATLMWDGISARRGLKQSGVGTSRVAFGPDGISSIDPKREAEYAYSDIARVTTDETYWFLAMRNGDLLAVDGSTPGLDPLLMKQTGVTPLRLDPSARGKIRRAEEGRAGYVEEHPSRLRVGRTGNK